MCILYHRRVSIFNCCSPILHYSISPFKIHKFTRTSMSLIYLIMLYRSYSIRSKYLPCSYARMHARREKQQKLYQWFCAQKALEWIEQKTHSIIIILCFICIWNACDSLSIFGRRQRTASLSSHLAIQKHT